MLTENIIMSGQLLVLLEGGPLAERGHCLLRYTETLRSNGNRWGVTSPDRKHCSPVRLIGGGLGGGDTGFWG